MPQSIAPIPVAVDTFLSTSGDGAKFPGDFDAPAEIQALIDNSMSKAMTKVLMSAMGVMSDSLSQTFAQALQQTQRTAQPTITQALPLKTAAQPHSGRKALTKTKHSSMSKMDSITSVTDGVTILPPRERTTNWAKSTRLWKRAKAKLDSESDLSDIEEESYMDDSEDPPDPGSDYGIDESDPSQDTIIGVVYYN
ncbi:Hypothetical predicted protein [Pelobates cultripes]|uniref:Uncharacterized protein n=1 Tax=Pelobates cultripes TaxID=61616 RepID=A0AAD1RGP4_PELCU|nr:Hypothetical predicted protein [Pelobates cultripes]